MNDYHLAYVVALKTYAFIVHFVRLNDTRQINETHWKCVISKAKFARSRRFEMQIDFYMVGTVKNFSHALSQGRMEAKYELFFRISFFVFHNNRLALITTFAEF
mmetsp:Transcript_3855/g.5858  ORF Transcript_3855/g.5858 Transcript_3855/m.5858 type:complete len:104 (-) Transcript_3855:90-401(-)